MSNRPLRENIQQLTDAFVDGLFEALRKAIISGVAREADNAREILREQRRRPASREEGDVAPVRSRQARRKAKGLERAVDVDAGSSDIEETVVLDPELMLAALEGGGEPVAPRARSRTKSTTLLDEPTEAPAAEALEDWENAPTGPALREDEVAVQTAGGGVVIRRKRGAQAA